ncbi:MAG: 2-amino-4-hydroxy-6-hydroxymethyldihydropteridine diphosphokinase [Chromatiales bacterium]|nr:2-amino-4-hydroxy-6-hydroxymethyldihydropteridine diphosphokinase [Chromatiales bacterium]
MPAWIGLGSNLDDPPRQLRQALAALAELPDSRLLLQSGFYRSPPMDGTDQPDYVNAVAGLLTRMSADNLLAALLETEVRQGRVRGSRRWIARTLDLDLLTYGGAVIEAPALKVPHPGIASRNFVLLPLLATAPDLSIPGLGTVRRLAGAVSATGLARLPA